MQPDPDLAFLRHAVDAGLLSPAQADLCNETVQARAKAGQPRPAAVVAVELGLLDEAAVRAVLGELARRAPAPAAGSKGWGASVAKGAPAAAQAPDLSWDAVRPSARHARARTASERVVVPDPPPAPSPAERDPSEATAELQAVLPLPAATPDEGDSSRTMKLQAVLPLPPAAAPPDDDPSSRTMKLQAVLPLPEERAGPGAAPDAPDVTPLAAAIAEAASADRTVDLVAPAPTPTASAAAPVAPPTTRRARPRATAYFAAAAVALALLIALGARRSAPAAAAAAPSAAVPVEAPVPDEVAPGAFAPRIAAAPTPPPVARPDDVLAAFEAAVDRHIAAGHFAKALALEAGLTPDVGADPARRARIEAARRRVEEAHDAAALKERRALSALVEQGQVLRARQRAREASAWATGQVDFPREVEGLVRRRDAELSDLAAPEGLDLPRLEPGLRSLLVGFTDETTLLPNGAISLDYGAAHAALAEDLRVRAPPHELGVRLEAGALPVMAVHRLPLVALLDVTLEFVVLSRPRREEEACLALLLVDPDRREPLGYGLTWGGERVQLARGRGLVRGSGPGRPATPRVAYRLTLTAARSGPPALGGAVVEQRDDGWKIEVAPGPIPAGVGHVAVYVRGVDVCVTTLQVRGVVDPARLPAR